MFEYKGYTGVIDTADSETGWFTGSVFGILDVVTFDGKSVPELQKAFRESVDDYLEFCKARKESPEKPFSGKFVVRLSPDLHRQVSAAARQEDVSLNAWMIAAVEMHLQQRAFDARSMSFDEMGHLAECVAAILAERQHPRRVERAAKQDKRHRRPLKTASKT